MEKVSKSAFGAAGAAVEHAAPAAEAALGASAYFGVLRVAGALTAASRRAKESATRTFCRKHAFPAVAAAASPHVVVAAAAHCADVAAKITTAAVAREAFVALVAALERATPECASSDINISMDEEETEEAWRVARDAASWAARAVVSEAPCAEEAFGQSQAFFESLAERLVARAGRALREARRPCARSRRSPRRRRGPSRRARRRRSRRASPRRTPRRFVATRPSPTKTPRTTTTRPSWAPGTPP